MVAGSALAAFSSQSLAILVILTFGSFAVVQGIKLQQLSLVVNGIMAASAAALVADNLRWRAFCWRWQRSSPNWRCQWQHGWRCGRSATGVGGKVLSGASQSTMAVLLAGSEYVLPGWISRFRDAVSAYREYTQGASSLLEVLTTPVIGKILVAATVLVVAAVGWRLRRVAHDSVAFSAMLALVLAATVVIVPSFAPYNQVLLLPAVFLIATSWRELWEPQLADSRRLRGGRAGGFLAVAGLLRTAGRLLLFLPAAEVQRAWTAPLRNSLLLPVVVLGVFILCARDRLKASARSAFGGGVSHLKVMSRAAAAGLALGRDHVNLFARSGHPPMFRRMI